MMHTQDEGVKSNGAGDLDAQDQRAKSTEITGRLGAEGNQDHELLVYVGLDGATVPSKSTRRASCKHDPKKKLRPPEAAEATRIASAA
jgi:hypothetical protein